MRMVRKRVIDSALRQTTYTLMYDKILKSIQFIIIIFHISIERINLFN